MDHLTNAPTEGESVNDEEKQQLLPTLSESGHLHFQAVSIPAEPKMLQSPKKFFRIIVEGNIGSGKTTFLQIFAKNCASMAKKPLIVPEPINLWRDVGGVNIFQLLADDPKRWSFAFQSYVQLTMIKVSYCFCYL